MQPKVGGRLHPRLNTGARPIADKYREGRWHFEESSIDRETVGREAQGVEVVVLCLGSACGAHYGLVHSDRVGPSVGEDTGSV